MAYSGGIDYLELDFNGVEWIELKSPWTRPGWEKIQPVMPRLPGGGLSLGGVVREFDERRSVTGESLLVYDRPYELTDQMCVVLEKERGMATSGSRTNYIMLVVLMDSKAKTWKRIRAEYLPERCHNPE
jgi:hypothetical protein